MNVKEYKRIIDDAIAEFAKDFYKHPFCYVYEADIQADLYCRIRDKLIKNSMFVTEHKDIPLYTFTNSPKDRDWIREKTSLLHCQTAIPSKKKNKKGAKQHFDIGFWNEDEVDKFSNHTDKAVSIAVEIKYNWESSVRKKRGYGFLKILQNFLDDIKKLGKVDFGYALWCLPQICDKGELAEVRKIIQDKVGRYKIIVYLINAEVYYGWKLKAKLWKRIGE